MNITEVKVRKLIADGTLKAVVSVTLDNCFVIHDIKIIETTSKAFVVMPTRLTSEGQRKDICHPINAETRALFEKTILDAYYKEAQNLDEAKPEE